MATSINTIFHLSIGENTLSSSRVKKLEAGQFLSQPAPHVTQMKYNCHIPVATPSQPVNTSCLSFRRDIYLTASSWTSSQDTTHRFFTGFIIKSQSAIVAG